MPGTRSSECANTLKPTISPHFGYSLRAELGRGQVTPRSEGRFAPMKRKGAPAKEGKCPHDAPKDQKCNNCRSKKDACQFAARIAAANATLSPGEPSTSERPRPQAAATPIWTMPNQGRHASARPLSASRSTSFEVGQLAREGHKPAARNPRRPMSPPLRNRSSPARWTSSSATSASRPPSTVP